MHTELEQYYKRSSRQLKRKQDTLLKLQELHEGNEPKYTYWGGYDLGYLKGQISVLEDILDILSGVKDCEQKSREFSFTMLG